MDKTSTATPTLLLAAARELFSADIDNSSDVQLADDLRTLQTVRNVVEAEFIRRLGAFDARGGAATEHFLSTQAWVRRSCNMSATAAHGRVLLARRLRIDSVTSVGTVTAADDVVPADADADADTDTETDTVDAVASPGGAERSLADAVFAGDLSYEHAVTITRTLDELPPAAHTAAEHLRVAQAGSMDPGTLKQFGTAIRETLAPELLVEDAATAHELRYVNVSVTMNGRVAIDGMLDAEGGAHLLAAVNALATSFGPDDNRTAGQRRHDALIEVVAVGLRAGELPATGGAQANIAMTLAAPYLKGGSGIPVARTAAGLVLVGSTVDRIVCDSAVGRIITAGPSQVLDVGREVRLATPAQRRGLAIRDGGCVGYECNRPPVWTDVHHVVPWSLHGPTDFDLLCLLCRRHHILVHDDGWVCVPDGTGWMVLPPALARERGAVMDHVSTRLADDLHPASFDPASIDPSRMPSELLAPSFERALPALLRGLKPPPTAWLHHAEVSCP